MTLCSEYIVQIGRDVWQCMTQAEQEAYKLSIQLNTLGILLTIGCAIVIVGIILMILKARKA